MPDTSEIQIYPFEHKGKKIHLIDTPGFDDTYRTDVDVLKDLSYWLNKSYQQKIRLSGIIYLHRIIDPRLGGTARKNLEMFKKLCGVDSFGAVVLATTMWERVTLEEGGRREQELRTIDEFYKYMLDNGATMMRHQDNKESATDIITHLVNRGKTTVLKMQLEMSEQGLELQQTAAGQELNSEMLQQTEIFNKRLKETEERMQKALEEKDNQLAKDLALQQDELNQRILSAQKGREELHITMQKLFEEKEKQFIEMKKQYEEDCRQREEVVRQRDQQLEKFKMAIQRAEELQVAKELEFQEELNRRERQAQVAQGETLKAYKESMENLIAQKREYDQKIRDGLQRVEEEEIRRRNERMKIEYETSMTLAMQRMQLMQQPAFYPGYKPQSAYGAAGSAMTSKLGTAIGGAAGVALTPIVLGAATMMCNIM